MLIISAEVKRISKVYGEGNTSPYFCFVEDEKSIQKTWGEIWGADSVVIAVRPQRYTMEFLNENDTFALSFYGDNKQIHKVCGSESGRDVNKTEKTGLTPVFDEGTVYFKEAEKVIICKKQYVSRLDPEKFIDKEPLKWYPTEDYHYMIIGKIIKVLEK